MTLSPVSEFLYPRRVTFAETDMAGIAHFASYFEWLEEAEHAFLRSVGLSVDIECEGYRVGFPRIAARLEYRRPARFEDEIHIELRVARIGTKSLTYQFLLEVRGVEIARGEVSASCCRCYPDGRLEAVPVPAILRSRIAESAREPLEFGSRRTA